MNRRRRALAASVLALNLNIVATAGVIFCEDSMACVNLPGYTCKNDRCVCEPSHSGLFPCVAHAYGEKCRTNEDCQRNGDRMECSASEHRTCRCQPGLLWDEATRRCYLLDDTSFYTGSFDPVRDLIIPGIIVMTIGAMVYLGIKLFCNCGKLWRRRRRRPELPRDLEESHGQPATWVASYRVFSSLNGVEPRGAPPALSPSQQFPLHPTPCMGLFLPAGTLAPPPAPAAAAAASPPSYEESLKHKVILSSYPLTVVLPPAQSPPPLPPPPIVATSTPTVGSPTSPQSAALHTPIPVTTLATAGASGPAN